MSANMLDAIYDYMHKAKKRAKKRANTARFRVAFAPKRVLDFLYKVRLGEPYPVPKAELTLAHALERRGLIESYGQRGYGPPRFMLTGKGYSRLVHRKLIKVDASNLAIGKMAGKGLTGLGYSRKQVRNISKVEKTRRKVTSGLMAGSTYHGKFAGKHVYESPKGTFHALSSKQHGIKRGA